MAWRCQRSLSPGRVEDVLTHFQGPLHPHTGNASAICFPFSCNSVPPWVYISPSQLERVSPEWRTWEVSEQRKSRCEKVAAHRKFKKILITSTGCKKVCGLQQSFFVGPGIFAESMFSLRNVIMNNYCFRLQRRVTTPEHTHVALFPNLQEEKKKKKKRLEQKSSQILSQKKYELSTISATGFQQLLFILFTHTVRAEE